MNGFSKEQISFIKQLITNRNKETRHEVSDHLDNTLPVKKLESSAEGSVLVDNGSGGMWLPPASANGCVLTSDTTQTGGVKWVRESFIARKTQAADGSTGSIAASVLSGDFMASPLSLTGDSTNYILIIAHSYAPYISAGTAGHWDGIVYDNTAGAALAQSQLYAGGTGISMGGMTIIAYLAPFSGTKSVGLRFSNATGGNSTLINQAAATRPTTLTAWWMGSANHA